MYRYELRVGDTAGEKNPGAKLTNEKVREIRRLVAAGVDRGEVAKRFGVHRVHVNRIARRAAWIHVED